LSQRSAGAGSPWIPHPAEQAPACAESGSCTARTRYPTACLGQLGSSAQDAFHRIDARHCCRTGLVYARCSGLRSFTQHPCRPKRSGSTVTRSGRSVLPDAVDVALAGSAGDAEKMPLTDFCNRPTARAPTEPLDSLALTRLATSSAKVEGSVDAVPPASAVRSTLFRHGAAKADSARGRGAPDRTGPTLRGRVSASRRARRSTSDAPCRHLVRPARVSSSQTARTVSTPPPSRDAVFTIQSAFHRQMPPRNLLAQVWRSPSPFPRRCRLRAGFRRSAWPSLELPSGPRLRGFPSSVRERVAPPGARGSSPRTVSRMDAPSVNFCNRYGS
jgi:hypothetical protein